jgi:seryl-tRNA(Sec) selenium transferase
MGIYQKLGVRTVINAAGTLTRLGGSRLSPDVLDAMADASASFVHIDELQAKAGDAPPPSPAAPGANRARGG